MHPYTLSENINKILRISWNLVKSTKILTKLPENLEISLRFAEGMHRCIKIEKI